MVYVTSRDGKEFTARILKINVIGVEFKKIDLHYMGEPPRFFTIDRSDIVRMETYVPDTLFPKDLSY
jgi:hypothetical protein